MAIKGLYCTYKMIAIAISLTTLGFSCSNRDDGWKVGCDNGSIIDVQIRFSNFSKRNTAKLVFCCGHFGFYVVVSVDRDTVRF